MTISQIVNKFEEKPYMLKMGAGNLAKRLKSAPDDIRKAKKVFHQNKENNIGLPNILVLDIETAPLKGWMWRVWKTNVYQSQLIQDWFMLSWAARWLFSDNTMSDVLTPEEVAAEDDGRIVKKLWKLLEEADVVIAHNGDKFDIPKINTRFLINGLTPTTPYQKIDTLKVAKKEFGFSRNSLNAICEILGIEQKIDTNFDLWKRCMSGDQDALLDMAIYNERDVEILEEVYIKMRPWIKGHPSVSMFGDMDGNTCTACGSSNLIQVGEYITAVSAFDTYRCEECGAISRSRQSSIGRKHRKNLLVSVVK